MHVAKLWVAVGVPPLYSVFHVRGASQLNAEWICVRVDAVVADGFALTGGRKVVHAFLLFRIRHFATSGLASEASTTTAGCLEIPLLDATVDSNNLVSQTGYRH